MFRRHFRTSLWLWVVCFSAACFGLLLIASMQRAGSYNYLRSQLIAAGVGFVGAGVLSFADYHILLERWKWFAGAAVLLAASVFVFGFQVSGTDDAAWIALPFGLTVQPSEFIKLCLIFTFARHLWFLSEKDCLQRLPWLMTLALHAALPVAVIHLQGDDGTAIVFVLMFLFMALVAGVRLRYFALTGVFMLTAAPVLWFFLLNNEQRSRIMTLFMPDADYGWQQYQGKLSIGSGGLTGSGLFHGSRVTQEIVPEQENDFILTVAGEELGFIGCLAVLVLLLALLLLLLRQIRIAADMEGRSLCAGVFAMLAAQIFINLGMVLGFLPVIGVTLPLFSAGGSSEMATLLGIGLVQSVARHCRQR